MHKGYKKTIAILITCALISALLCFPVSAESYSFSPKTQAIFFYGGSSALGGTNLQSSSGNDFIYSSDLNNGNYYPAGNYQYDITFSSSPLQNCYVTFSWTYDIFEDYIIQNPNGISPNFYVQNSSMSYWDECEIISLNYPQISQGFTVSGTAVFKVPNYSYTSVLCRIPAQLRGNYAYPRIKISFLSVTSSPVDISGDIKNSTNDIMNNDNNNTNKITGNQDKNTNNIMNNDNNNTNKITDNQDKNAQSIIDNQNSLAEQEKQEITDSGNQSTDAMDSIPNESEGFINALGTFVSTMSTTDTACSITFPAIKTPSFAGIPAATLSEEKEVDFSTSISLIPSDIMRLIQALTTIALIVFCFKELYDTISEGLTRKKANSDG